MNRAKLHYIAVCHRSPFATGENPYAKLLNDMHGRLEQIHAEYLRINTTPDPPHFLPSFLAPLFQPRDYDSQRLARLLQLEAAYQRDKATLHRFETLLRLLFKLPKNFHGGTYASSLG